MPTLSLHGTLVSRNASVTAPNALQVVCAFPLSGQYGPGSRVLYYVLIAACVFARKAEWLRNACLAAALLFPAVAAIHGIVLAAIHQNDAVDMDVYGAFQLCAIGILAAPVTVKISRTYFYDPGRNAIFLWTGLILAGLLSLTVEFFRIQTFPCPYDNSGNPVSLNPRLFNYNNTCNITCSVEAGPFSPLRGGSANNIYVIPTPDKVTFGMATLLAAACCIPAILSLVSMWNKILEINWKSRFGARNEDERADEPIAGTNGATVKKMKGVNKVIRLFLSAVEVPLFGAAVLFILIIGEMNFWSSQVHYQTEPMASVGQWAPIAGTALAVIGSLYILLATTAVQEESNPNGIMHHCNCSTREVGNGLFTAPSHPVSTPGTPGVDRSSSDGHERTSNEIIPTMSRRSTATDQGNRRKVANALIAIGHQIGTATRDQFDDSEFKYGKAQDFPEIPGEEHRNSALPQIREQYNQYRDEDGNLTPLHRSPSRASSIRSFEVRSATPRAPSPRRTHANTLPVERTSSELRNTISSSSEGGPLRRRETLEVPSPVHHSPTRNNPSTSSISSVVRMPQGHTSPTIVVSSDPDASSPAHSPLFNSQAASAPPESISTPPMTESPPPLWLGRQPIP